MTPTPNVNDVAAAILGSFDRPISTMKLQKLAYLAQGWNLAIRNEPMFEGTFEAWVNGPVNRALYAQHRGEYSRSKWPTGDPSNLSEADQLVLKAVIQNYGGLSGGELSDLTHVAGTPWSTARLKAQAQPGEPARVPLDENEIRDHFRKILNLDSTQFQAWQH